MSARPDRPLPVELATLADRLAAAAARPVPEPDSAFVDGLEARLRTIHGAGEDPRARRPVARRLLPVGGATIVVSAVLVVGAAAAGIVATRALVERSDRPDRPELSLPATSSTGAGDAVTPPAHAVDTSVTAAPAGSPPSTAMPATPASEPPDATTTTAAPTVTTGPTTANTSPTSAPAVPPTTMATGVVPVPSTAAPAPQPSTATSTTPSTVPGPSTTAAPGPPSTTTPATAPATSAPATTSSTEPPASPVMSLACATVAGGVSCTWSPGPPGTASYVVLRGQASGGTGKVLTPAPGATSLVDTTGVSGTTYLFLVRAFDAGGTLLGYSNLVSATAGT